MIDLNLHLTAIEALMKLMNEHNIEELSVDFVNIKRGKQPSKVAILTEEQQLEQHLEPLPNAPWESISDEQLYQFDRTGKL